MEFLSLEEGDDDQQNVRSRRYGLLIELITGLPGLFFFHVYWVKCKPLGVLD